MISGGYAVPPPRAASRSGSHITTSVTVRATRLADRPSSRQGRQPALASASALPYPRQARASSRPSAEPMQSSSAAVSVPSAMQARRSSSGDAAAHADDSGTRARSAMTRWTACSHLAAPCSHQRADARRGSTSRQRRTVSDILVRRHRRATPAPLSRIVSHVGHLAVGDAARHGGPGQRNEMTSDGVAPDVRRQRRRSREPLRPGRPAPARPGPLRRRRIEVLPGNDDPLSSRQVHVPVGAFPAQQITQRPTLGACVRLTQGALCSRRCSRGPLSHRSLPRRGRRRELIRRISGAKSSSTPRSTSVPSKRSRLRYPDRRGPALLPSSAASTRTFAAIVVRIVTAPTATRRRAPPRSRRRCSPRGCKSHSASATRLR